MALMDGQGRGEGDVSNLIITTVHVFFSTPNHETGVNIYADAAHQELHIQEQDLAHAYICENEVFLLLHIY